MPALRCLVPLWIKGVAGVARKPLLHLPGRPLRLYLLKRLDAMLNKHVPIGYEDETGFHYGKPGDTCEHPECRKDD